VRYSHAVGARSMANARLRRGIRCAEDLNAGRRPWFRPAIPKRLQFGAMDRSSSGFVAVSGEHFLVGLEDTGLSPSMITVPAGTSAKNDRAHHGWNFQGFATMAVWLPGPPISVTNRGQNAIQVGRSLGVSYGQHEDGRSQMRNAFRR